VTGSDTDILLWAFAACTTVEIDKQSYMKTLVTRQTMYEGWNFNSGNYLFTTDTK